VPLQALLFSLLEITPLKKTGDTIEDTEMENCLGKPKFTPAEGCIGK
jgi:hypothetical protein